MKIAVITLFPEMFSALTDYGVTGRAIKQQRVTVELFNPRQFTDDKHQTVDDRPYGGGPGMLMRCEPLSLAIHAAKQWLLEQGIDNAPVVYLSPQGEVLRQARVEECATHTGMILLCGRYEGIDERIIALEVDYELSLGDYVLSGGELPAMSLMDSIIRLLPGVLGHDMSAVEDSFSHGLLDHPHYTRPEVFQGLEVPAVLLSGNHQKIGRWRYEQALERTQQRRPELLESTLAQKNCEKAGE